MQSLVLKFTVLAGVIAASCAVVYQAHKSISQNAQQTAPEEFQPIVPDLAATPSPKATDRAALQPSPLLGEIKPLPVSSLTSSTPADPGPRSGETSSSTALSPLIGAIDLQPTPAESTPNESSSGSAPKNEPEPTPADAVILVSATEPATHSLAGPGPFEVGSAAGETLVAQATGNSQPWATQTDEVTPAAAAAPARKRDEIPFQFNLSATPESNSQAPAPAARAFPGLSLDANSVHDSVKPTEAQPHPEDTSDAPRPLAELQTENSEPLSGNSAVGSASPSADPFNVGLENLAPRNPAVGDASAAAVQVPAANEPVVPSETIEEFVIRQRGTPRQQETRSEAVEPGSVLPELLLSEPAPARELPRALEPSALPAIQDSAPPQTHAFGGISMPEPQAANDAPEASLPQPGPWTLNLDDRDSVSPTPQMPRVTPLAPRDELPLVIPGHASQPNGPAPAQRAAPIHPMQNEPVILPAQSRSPQPLLSPEAAVEPATAEPVEETILPAPLSPVEPSMQQAVPAAVPIESWFDETPPATNPGLKTSSTRQPAPAAPAAPRVASVASTIPQAITQASAEDETAAARESSPLALLGTGTFDPNVPFTPQSPELRIEKIAPAEAELGEPIVYSIKVRNVGQNTAHNVVIEDRVPKGTELDGTSPRAYEIEGKLVWKLEAMKPGEEKTIHLRVIPREPGEIGSVATVSFSTSVAARIKVTAPNLSIQMHGPREAVVGDEVKYRFHIQNTGEGDAKEVWLRTILPPGLTHPNGDDIEYELGAIAAGESRDIELALTAAQSGPAAPQALLTINGQTKANSTAQLRVIDSRLRIARTGPARRFVGRPADYVTTVTNDSAESLNNVKVVETLPKGVELSAVPLQGNYDRDTRTIQWLIPQLGAGEARELHCQIVAAEAGEHAGTLVASDNAGNMAEVATALNVKGFADLDVDMQQYPRQPVAAGEQVSIRMVVKNEGSALASNVQAAFELPSEVAFVNARSDVQHNRVGSTVTFALGNLPVGEEQTLDIVLVSSEKAPEGTVKVKTLLMSDESQTPLQAEEELRIFRDAP